MDQFVLNLFQEHLSKIIIGFRKEQVNANLFNGKGEISNIEINCSIINEHLRRITPFIEFERIHVSNLSFHVSSWTNLRNSPIRIDIDHVHVTIVEPLYYETDQTKRKRIRQVTIEELTQLMKNGVIPKPRQSSYNLVDRILDNLVIEIRSMHITYQPCGIFKTRRPGPWTPPTLLIQLFGIRWITIDEYGFEIQNNITAGGKNYSKNQQSRHHHHKKKDGSFYIDKRLEADYKISLIYSQPASHGSTDTQNTDTTANNYTDFKDQNYERETTIIPLISSSSSTFNGHYSNTSTLLDPRKKMNVHFIIQRRIRNGEYLAVQVDMIVPLVEVLVFMQEERTPYWSSSSTSSTTTDSLSNAKKLSALVQFLTAMQFCVLKDRAFTDPLRPVGSVPNKPQSSTSSPVTDSDTEKNSFDSMIDEVIITTVEPSTSQGDVSADNLKADEEISLPMVDLTLADGLSDSSSDDDDDNNDETDDIDQKPSNEFDKVETTAKVLIDQNSGEVSINSASTTTRPTGENKPVTSSPSNMASSGRHLLVFSNGMIVHDKFSFSVNIHELQMSGQYDTTSTSVTDGDFRVEANGVVMEIVWPIVTREKGIYVQATIASFSMHERCGKRMRPLLLSGCGMTDHPKFDKQPPKQTNETKMNQNIFPSFEDRSVRPNNFEFRQKHPHRSFGIKLTVTDAKKKLPLQMENKEKELMLFPEVGIDEFELIVDSNAWTRIARFGLNLDYEGYDSRWWTGDYEQNVASEMLIHPSTTFAISDYLQSSESELRDVHYLPLLDNFKTAIHMTNLTVRLPAVTDDKIMLCDVIIRCDETIIKFSRDLPRTVLENHTTSEQILFYNNPSNLEQAQQNESDAASLSDKACNQSMKFGLHLAFIGLSLTVIPIIPFCPSYKTEKILTPSDFEMLLRLDVNAIHVAAEDAWTGMESTFLLAAHRCEANIDLEMLAVALTTGSLHHKIISEFIGECTSRSCSRNSMMDEFQQHKQSLIERVDQYWKNGTICICFSLRIEMLRIRLWRQNVPRHQPMNTKRARVIEVLSLLMIADFFSKDFSININMLKTANQRRLLGIISSQELSLACCDFDRILEFDKFWMDVNKNISLEYDPQYTENQMVEIFSIRASNSETRSLDARIEVENGDTWMCAFDADFTDVIIGIYAESLTTVALLIVDSLLLAFPTLHTSARVKGYASNECNSKQSCDDEKFMSNSIEVEKVLEWYNTMISKSIDVLLVRIGFKNVQMLMSDTQSKDESFIVELLDSSMILSYISSFGSPNIPNILERFLIGRSELSSLVEEKKYGVYHTVKSKQRIQFCTSDRVMASRPLDKNIAVDVFDFIYTYYHGNVAISTSDDFTSASMEKLIRCVVAAQHLWRRYEGALRPVLDALYYRVKESSRARIHKEWQDALSNPVYHVCTSIAATMASLNDMSSVIQNKIHSLWRVSQKFKSEKDDEIAKLRVLLLLKENHRLKIQSLASSEATGWLRIGKSQRSGLHGSITCTLWHYWVILRRSSLLLFARPGQHGIASIVCLEGATLHEVGGDSRKHDLKRAFALTEITGNTYILTASCDDEYITWVNAILNATNAHSTNGSKSQLGESLLEPKNDTSTADKGQLSRSIAKVVEGTKIKEQEIARSVIQSGQISDDNLARNHTTSTESGTKIHDPPSNIGGSTRVAPRINQIRNRIAGVSHVTKGRIGSSISAARKKGKEAIQKRLLNTGSTVSVSIDSSFADEVAFYSAPEAWKCHTCSNLNMLEMEKCKTCECLRSDSQIYEEAGAPSSANITSSDQTQEVDYVGNLSIINVEESSGHSDGDEVRLHVDDPSNLSDCIDDEAFKSQSGIKQRLSAVVQRAKIATSGRQMFGRQQDNQHYPVAGSTHGQKVCSIDLNGPLREHKFPFGETRNQYQDSPMKKVEGNWVIRVSVHRKTPCENGDVKVDDNGEKLAIDIKKIRDTNSDEQIGWANVADASPPNSSDMIQFVDVLFKVQVLTHSFGSICGSEPTEFTRNLSEIGALHTTLSESISHLPPYKFEDSFKVGANDSAEAPPTSLYNQCLLDNLLMSGRILGDLLDMLFRDGTQHVSIANSSAIFVEAFLNEIVNAPLPLDCLTYVKDFLHLPNNSANNARDRLDRVRDSSHQIILKGDNGTQMNESLLESSKCISTLSTHLSNAHDQTLTLVRTLESMQRNYIVVDETSLPSFIEPCSQHLPSNQLSDGIFSTLNEVMQERDEAQSRLTMVEILHRKERDELNLRLNDLVSQLEVSKRSQDLQSDKNMKSNEKSIFTANTRENRAIYDSDLELQSLCQQLAGEISARTAAELSLVRMKENRKLEEEREASERQALQDEVGKLRETVLQMSAREKKIIHESRTWRESFEALVHCQFNAAT